MEKMLFLSPHSDDEILGMGGSISKFVKDGHKCYVYYVGIDERDAGPGRPVKEKRLEELKKVAKFFGFEPIVNEKNLVNNYVERDLIKQFEEVINKIKPNRVFIPFPSYNQDHRTVYNAALIALRPHDRNHFVSKVLVYEQEHVVVWDPKPNLPTYYIPIDIERKLAAYKIYETQVRGMRPPELLRSIAKIRGVSANVPYAEACQVYRWVD